ncbi:11439_t:CDS:2 [Funneliformis geosporum]|uniref:15088_t:CDS:1 n=1 Tax=Funneliformis geosporum TaxID=1117311 RepID=A0A9W4SBW8_9GLOM|nr:15088_t:CDS:2 [Funneliformis geosporum]CAI2171327.1 11439_t:CDS:2 [Funneliformis geosporum]
MDILGDSIAALSPDELSAEHKVLAEFANLTNSQVYEHIFSQRMMLPKRNVASLHSASDILGTDSCELMLPTLHEALQTELFNTKDSPEFHLLDIGASSGEIIDWCLAKELEKNIQLNRQNIIHVVEPNLILLKAYQQKICEFPHLNQGIVYNGRVQDYLVNHHHFDDFETPLPLTPLDFINGLHVINYLLPSSFYARSLADMAVLLLTGQLSNVNERRFDTKLLDNVLRQLKEAALTPVGMNEKKRFGLTRCMRGGEMVWKVDFPLIISIIRKEKVHM